MHADVSALSYATLPDALLLELLRTQEDRLPPGAAEEIVARADTTLGTLQEICLDERGWRSTGPAGWAPVHATYLLGAIGGPRALLGLMAALRESARAGVAAVRDLIPSILGRLGRPALPLLRAAAFDRDAGDAERVAAVEALAAVGARHPVEQGEILDLLRGAVEDERESPAVRGAAGRVLLAFARPGDRVAALVEALRQKWTERPLFDENDVDAAFGRGEPELSAYLRDWMGFYEPERISERRFRRLENEQDARWAAGAAAGAAWVETERGRLLARYEHALEGLDDLTRGDAVWVAESMTEYLVRHEGAAPWRWTGRTTHAYLTDAFARRLAADQPGRIASVPDGMARFVRFCGAEGLVRGRDLREALDRVESAREDVVGAVLDPERRRQARSTFRRLLARGEDPGRLPG